jgi:hypothetical protein
MKVKREKERMLRRYVEKKMDVHCSGGRIFRKNVEKSSFYAHYYIIFID